MAQEESDCANVLASTLCESSTNCQVYWQAHRGGGADEAPDNTMAAFYYAWSLGGIPEADIRTTQDGIIICLHDNTLARTTTAPADLENRDISAVIFSELSKLDAGAKFDERFAGQVIPSLAEVFCEMWRCAARQLYLDVKDVDLEKLGAMIDRHGLGGQILIASPRQRDCKILKKIATDVRTMLWIGGSADEIVAKFNAAETQEFDGLDQIQLHLNDRDGWDTWRYQLERDFLEQALRRTTSKGIDLEVFPMRFDDQSLFALLDLGIRWYATDVPKCFAATVEKWQTGRQHHGTGLG